MNEEAGRSYRELSGEVGMVYIIFSILAPKQIVAAMEHKTQCVPSTNNLSKVHNHLPQLLPCALPDEGVRH